MATRKAKTGRAVGTAWTDGEVRACVRGYNTLLAQEQAGEKTNKAAMNRKLRNGYLKARSKGSVEMKMMNISAAREALGLPVIKGYKAFGNAQASITEIVTAEEK